MMKKGTLVGHVKKKSSNFSSQSDVFQGLQLFRKKNWALVQYTLLVMAARRQQNWLYVFSQFTIR